MTGSPDDRLTALSDQAPETIVVQLLSDTTFGRGEPSAGEVDVEVEHDSLGLPFLGGKALHGLLRDSWTAMAPHFPELEGAALGILGREGSQDEACILRIGDAGVDAATREWIRQAEGRAEHPLSPGEVLRAMTDIRYQTAEERTTGAPATTTLRASRVVLRGVVLIAPVQWLTVPGTPHVRCLALGVLGVRHAGLGRNRGRGHILVALHLPAPDSPVRTSRAAFEADLDSTRRFVRGVDQ